MTFKERYNKNLQCPKCKSHIIFVCGCGWDNDREYCVKCDYEIEYETSMLIEEKSNEDS